MWLGQLICRNEGQLSSEQRVRVSQRGSFLKPPELQAGACWSCGVLKLPEILHPPCPAAAMLSTCPLETTCCLASTLELLAGHDIFLGCSSWIDHQSQCWCIAVEHLGSSHQSHGPPALKQHLLSLCAIARYLQSSRPPPVHAPLANPLGQLAHMFKIVSPNLAYATLWREGSFVAAWHLSKAKQRANFAVISPQDGGA